MTEHNRYPWFKYLIVIFIIVLLTIALVVFVFRSISKDIERQEFCNEEGGIYMRPRICFKEDLNGEIFTYKIIGVSNGRLILVKK